MNQKVRDQFLRLLTIFPKTDTLHWTKIPFFAIPYRRENCMEIPPLTAVRTLIGSPYMQPRPQCALNLAREWRPGDEVVIYGPPRESY